MAEISKEIIVNMALAHIGDRSNVEDLAGEQTTEAEQGRLWYDYSRQQVLESHDWNFARRRVAGTLHADTIPTTAHQPWAGTWGFRYRYPANCLAMRKVQHPSAPPADAVPFDIELSIAGTEKTILTNMENAVLVYTFDQERSELYTPGFVLAFSLFLASNMSFSLSGKLSLAQTLTKRAFQAVGVAAANMANEQVSPPPRDADWVRARSGGAASGGRPDWTAYPDGQN